MKSGSGSKDKKNHDTPGFAPADPTRPANPTQPADPQYTLDDLYVEKTFVLFLIIIKHFFILLILYFLHFSIQFLIVKKVLFVYLWVILTWFFQDWFK